jgi:hypothetical protein
LKAVHDAPAVGARVPGWALPKLLDRLVRGLRLLFRRLPADPRLEVFRAALAGTPMPAAERPVVAVQCVEDPMYFAVFGALLEQFAQHGGVRAELVVVRAINAAIGIDRRARLLRSRLLGRVLSAQWVRANAPLAAGVAYRSLAFADPLTEWRDARLARRLWQQARQRGGDFALEIDGVPVGDLVIDAYLRFRPSPRFDAADPFVGVVVRQAVRDVRQARRYFARRRPALYLCSYATYLEHGIAARVALQQCVRVVSFGNFTRIGRELTLQDWFHTADTTNYRADFDALPEPDDRLAEAERQLQVRLHGGIDAATSYMRVSAYGAPGKPVPAEVRGAVVVFLHDFYDSPHIYHDLVFPDFWTWVEFTVTTLTEAGIPFFVKPHPNQVHLSGEALLALRARHPALRLLDSGISNTRLAEAGMSCGVTVYGTVAHELAYLGVPCIACARHPHHAFDLCRTARTVDEYRAMLRTPAERPVDLAQMRRQALSFYYMHNLHGDAAALELRAAFIGFWRSCHADHPAPPDLLQAFDRLRLSRGFVALAANLLARTNEHAG